MTPMDTRTASNLSTLHPKAQERFRAFYAAGNAYLEGTGLELRFVSGTRSYAEQGQMYAKGRTVMSDVPCIHAGVARAPGKCKAHPLGATVTNAKPGESNHNFQVGGDCGLFKVAPGKKAEYLAESPYYAKLGPIGEKCGLKWGGRWKKPDRPHYEFPTGLNVKQMAARVAAGVPIIA